MASSSTSRAAPPIRKPSTSGFAEYIDVDPTIVRLVYTALTLFTAGFPGILFYIICAIVIPQKPFDVEP